MTPLFEDVTRPLLDRYAFTDDYVDIDRRTFPEDQDERYEQTLQRSEEYQRMGPEETWDAESPDFYFYDDGLVVYFSGAVSLERMVDGLIAYHPVTPDGHSYDIGQADKDEEDTPLGDFVEGFQTLTRYQAHEYEEPLSAAGIQIDVAGPEGPEELDEPSLIIDRGPPFWLAKAHFYEEEMFGSDGTYESIEPFMSFLTDLQENLEQKVEQDIQSLER